MADANDDIFQELARRKRRKVSTRRIFTPSDDDGDDDDDSCKFTPNRDGSMDMMYDDEDEDEDEESPDFRCAGYFSANKKRSHGKKPARTRSIITEPKLHTLLRLNPRLEKDRQRFDNNVILQEVHRHPSAAATKCHRLGFGSYYPLHMAIALGASKDLVESLYNAFPQAAKEECRFTTGNLLPLHLACEFRSSPSVLSFLIDKHPDALHHKLQNGQIPLHLACKYNLPSEIISLLIDKMPNSKHAIKKNDNDDNKGGDNDGDTPLHILCNNSAPSITVVSLILEKFPHFIKQKNKYGDTPLHHLCRSHVTASSHDVLSLLLKKCPDLLFEKDLEGNTPLHITLRSNKVRLFLFQHVSAILRWDPCFTTRVLQERNNFGDTPLHVACRRGAPFQVISLVLGKYPKALCEQNNYGETPFIITQRKDAYSQTMTRLAFVKNLLSNNNNNNATMNTETAEQHIQDFIKAKWYSIIPLMLDVHPTTKLVLKIDAEVVSPTLYAIVGHRCKLLTLWKMMRDKQEIFEGVV